MDEEILEEQLEIAERLLEGNGIGLRYAGLAIVDYFKTVMSKVLVENLGEDESDAENMDIKRKFTHIKVQAPELKCWEELKGEIRETRQRIAHTDYSSIPEKEKLEEFLEKAPAFKEDVLEKTSDNYTSIDSFGELYTKKMGELEEWISENKQILKSFDGKSEKVSRYEDLTSKLELPSERYDNPKFHDIKNLLKIESMINELEEEYNKAEEALEEMARESRAETIREEMMT